MCWCAAAAISQSSGALFVGSTADSGSFHPRIIDIALRMQFICGDQLITTSAVQSLSRHPASTTSTESASAL
jgi:hypothetical protein